MRLRNLAALGGSALAAGAMTVGCATHNPATASALVTTRARFDLDCEAVETQQLGASQSARVDGATYTYTVGARGCGRRATYVVDCRGQSRESCTAILNADAERDSAQ